MATWDDVRRLALSLPETSEQVSHGHASWRVRDKGFVWERPLRASDVRALGEGAPTGPVLGARVEHLIAKDALLDGYAAVLVRLEEITCADLEELVVEAWLVRAPKRLAREYVRTRWPDRSG
jgi:hypothetical protein